MVATVDYEGWVVADENLNSLKSSRECEDFFRAFFESAVVGAAIVDPDDRWHEVNTRLAQMLGYTPEELYSMTWRDLTPPEDLPAEDARIREILAVGDSGVLEKRYRRKDGTLVDVEVLIRIIRGAGGTVHHYLALISDITERKRAEKNLRMMVDMLDEAPSSITVHDFEGRCLYANSRTFEIHGCDEHEFMSLNLRELDVPESEALISERMRLITEKGEARFEVGHFRKDRSTVPLEVFVRKVEWDGVPAMLSIVTDISERKRAEEEHEKLYDRLMEAGRLASVGRLAGGVAHEFNNMLAVVLGNAELALEQVDPEHPLRADVEEIHKAARRSATLVRQLLGFARKQTVTPKVIDLNDTVVRMLGTLGGLIGENIDLAWVPAADLWPVRIDIYQVDQILANLCANARDAIAGAGRVTLKTRNATLNETECAGIDGCIPGGYVLLSVTDDGCGMDETTRSHLFEPFFTTKPFGQGAGLGLASVYGIVRQNQGFISVESQPGMGTTFGIYLPRYRTENMELQSDSMPQTRHDVVATAGEKLLPGHGKTVLLVEDETAILKLTKRLLERLGYNVLAAGTPDEALRMAETHDISILVTDVVMPGIDGRELATRIGARMPNLKCLFVSAYPVEAIAARGVLDSDMHFIQKPFTFESLAQAISRLNGGA